MGFFFFSTGLQQINLDFSKIGEFWNEKNKIIYYKWGSFRSVFVVVHLPWSSESEFMVVRGFADVKKGFRVKTLAGSCIAKYLKITVNFCEILEYSPYI